MVQFHPPPPTTEGIAMKIEKPKPMPKLTPKMAASVRAKANAMLKGSK